MPCKQDKPRLEGAEAYEYEVRCLRTLIDRREASRLALLFCDATGELWEETAEGLRVEILVLTRIERDEAEAKYGPVGDLIKSGPKKLPRMPRPRTVHRICRTLPCPLCATAIQFSVVSLNNPPEPFMYCDRCSNVLMRKQDEVALHSLLSAKPADGPPDQELIMQFYHDLEHIAPACPCGGKFQTWSNVKCPACAGELPYNHGYRHDMVRAFESKVIVVKDAVVIGDTGADSWVCGCMPTIPENRPQ